MELASRWKQASLGQYFTPWPIALMMAQMSVYDHDWEATPHPMVNEPAVGSGVMLLAFRGVVAKSTY